jgi:Family of unknown function (DUF5681)
MTFRAGESGNPAGRAVGSRNRKTLAVEAALFDHAEALVKNLVDRALAGEPAAMRLAMERVLPAGRGRPLPIDLPPVRSAEDAQAAAAVIMAALKEGAISAREAVDLLRVIEGLTRLTGAIDVIKKIARKEVAKAAAALGMEHFFAGPPAGGGWRAEDGDQMTDVGGRMSDDDVAFPGRTAARSAAVQTCPGRTAARSGAVQTRDPPVDPGSAPHRSATRNLSSGRAERGPGDAAAHPGNSGEGNSGLQIVADSAVYGGGSEDA